ncbi:MAG: ElyC/SanA/YdcF family protein [Lachnospiraceae bacterium]|nr:ElyC/SanA/YdcF family protein [Lachnospiraceae bacterium]
MNQQIADDINILGHFCGKRDVLSLEPQILKETYGIQQVDVMVLFGGSILSGGDVLAKAISQHVAKTYVIVGGAGHTTQTLRYKMKEVFPHMAVEDMTEAELFQNYIKWKYDVTADYLEYKSTNCGNNITYLLALLDEKKIFYQSMILVQDACMQYRMEATLRNYVSKEVCIINYAAYQVKVIYDQGKLLYDREINGMWEMDRYLSLLMGEIPRLLDDEHGYGPKGKGFIAHVDIPDMVWSAYLDLKKVYQGMTRKANPLYASVDSDQ